MVGSDFIEYLTCSLPPILVLDQALLRLPRKQIPIEPSNSADGSGTTVPSSEYAKSLVPFVLYPLVCEVMDCAA